MTSQYTSSAAAMYAFKSAFFTIATAQHASDNGVRVSWGHPGSGMRGFDDLIVLKNVRLAATDITMTPRHTQETTLELDVEYSAFKSGSDLPDDQDADKRAYELLAVMDKYSRSGAAYSGDTTLGDVVRWCHLTSAESAGVTENEFLAQGRLSIVLCTFTAVVRITD